MAAYRSQTLSTLQRLPALAILFGYTAVSLLSLYLMVASSLTRLGASFQLSDLDWYPKDWAWSNYAEFFVVTHGYALVWLRNTVLIALGPTLVNLLFSAMAGYTLARIEFPGRTVYFWAIIGVMAIPAFVTLIPLYQMMFRFGWFDSFFALIVPRMAGIGGVFMFRQFMITLPEDIIQAARIDGASEWTIFSRIILPMARPVLAVMFLLDFVSAWNDYFWPYLITNSKDMMTLQVGLISILGVDQGAVRQIDYGVIMAGALMTSLPIIVLFIALQRFFIQGLTMGAVKG
jgi:multiple sugar transport system permease protein